MGGDLRQVKKVGHKSVGYGNTKGILGYIENGALEL